MCTLTGNQSSRSSQCEACPQPRGKSATIVVWTRRTVIVSWIDAVMVMIAVVMVMVVSYGMVMLVGGRWTSSMT